MTEKERKNKKEKKLENQRRKKGKDNNNLRSKLKRGLKIKKKSLKKSQMEQGSTLFRIYQNICLDISLINNL